jgi:hypothetical protein
MSGEDDDEESSGGKLWNKLILILESNIVHDEGDTEGLLGPHQATEIMSMSPWSSG